MDRGQAPSCRQPFVHTRNKYSFSALPGTLTPRGERRDQGRARSSITYRQTREGTLAGGAWSRRRSNCTH